MTDRNRFNATIFDLGKAFYVGDGESERRCAEAAGVGSFAWARDFFTSR